MTVVQTATTTPVLDFPKPSSVTELRFKNFFSVPDKQFSDQKNILHKIKWYVGYVLSILIKGLFFVSNPSLFALGFIGGIIWDEPSFALDRIRLVWTKQSGFFMTAMFVGGCFLTLPVIVSVTSFLWAAEIGSQNYQQALKADNRLRVRSVVGDKPEMIPAGGFC